MHKDINLFHGYLNSVLKKQDILMLYSVFHMLGVIDLGCVNLCLNLYSGTDAIFLNLLLFPVRL